MYQRQVNGRCPVCETPDAACGPGAPADPVITSDRGEVRPMSGELKVYDVRVGGTKVQMKLNEADAKRRGVWEEPEPAPKPAAKPKRKAPAKNKKATIEDTASGGE